MDAWGAAWGNPSAWGDSWGTDDVTPTQPPVFGGGGGRRDLKYERELRGLIEKIYNRLSGEEVTQDAETPSAPIAQRIAKEIAASPAFDFDGVASRLDALDAMIGMYIEDMERQAREAAAIREDDEVAALLLLTTI